MNVIDSLQGFVEENLSLLLPVDQIWQPTDYLSILTAHNWSQQIEDCVGPATIARRPSRRACRHMATGEHRFRATPCRLDHIVGRIRPASRTRPGLKVAS